MHRIITAAVAAALCAASAARAQGLSPFPKATDDLVRAELIADVASIAPGSTFRLGVHLTMKEGWHVNWTNPGDAGLAPSIKWILPPVLKPGIITWPLPARIMTGPLAIFGGGVACVVAAIVFFRRLPVIRRLVRPIYMQKGIVPEVASGIQGASGTNV